VKIRIEDHADTEAMECPNCSEIALQAMTTKTDNNGKDFTVYECNECHMEQNY